LLYQIRDAAPNSHFRGILAFGNFPGV